MNKEEIDKINYVRDELKRELHWHFKDDKDLKIFFDNLWEENFGELKEKGSPLDKPHSKEKKYGYICQCGNIFLDEEFFNPESEARRCCDKDYTYGYLKEDGKTFIGDL